MTRVIILAAGDNSRWQNFRETPNHLTKVEGKVLLERTVDQFLKYTDDVCVIGGSKDYVITGSSLYIVKSPHTQWGDCAKFLSSKNMWNANGRTVLVFGDTYFTSGAVKKIMTDKSDYKFFLRTGPSKLSGAKQKEMFALGFSSAGSREVNQKLMHLVSTGNCQHNAAWSLYIQMIGTTANGLFNNPHFVEIDDWTTDFDTPEDLETWETNRKLAKKPKNSTVSE